VQVVPQQLQGEGRGLVATRPIGQGEQVLAVPQDLVLFPPTAAAGMDGYQAPSQHEICLPHTHMHTQGAVLAILGKSIASLIQAGWYVASRVY